MVNYNALIDRLLWKARKIRLKLAKNIAAKREHRYLLAHESINIGEGFLAHRDLMAQVVKFRQLRDGTY